MGYPVKVGAEFTCHSCEACAVNGEEYKAGDAALAVDPVEAKNADAIGILKGKGP